MEEKYMYDNDNIITVRNWSSEPFTFSWDGNERTLGVGESKAYPEYLALHAIKHLTDRELHRAGFQANHQDRAQWEAKAVVDTTQTPNPVAAQEALNNPVPPAPIPATPIQTAEVAPVVAPADVKRKPGRPPKETFAGLNATPQTQSS